MSDSLTRHGRPQRRGSHSACQQQRGQRLARSRRRGQRSDGPRVVLAAVLALVLMLVPVQTGSLAWAEEAGMEPVYAEDELIIVYEDEPLELDEPLDVGLLIALEVSGSLTAEVTLEDVGVVAQEELVWSGGDGSITVAELSEDASVEEVIEQIEDDPAIAYAQPNYSYELLSTTTSDTYFSSDTSSEYNQYYLFESNFDDAWDYVRAEGQVTVAVLDTGCCLTHEDLQGTVDAELAWDATTSTPLAEAGVENDGDAIGHGTEVAGIIAAYADNATGIAGASYNATILPIKVFDSSEECTTMDVVMAYGYLDDLIDTGELTDLCAINMSIGMYTSGTSVEDRALRSVIASMLAENDVLTVCAGGNGSSSENCYPADYEECVSVAALDTTGSVASWSDANAQKDLSAYGASILSTTATGGYAAGSGTSFAAPQVTAAVALVCAADPDLSAEEVVEILQETATAVAGPRSEGAGAGLVDAGAAVLEALERAEEDAEEGTGDSEASDAIVTSYVIFSDVLSEGAYYYEAVYGLADAGYVSGYADGSFGVGRTITRAEFATILWRIACPEEAAAYDNDAEDETGLSDVASGRYYTAAVNWAYDAGIMTGYSSGEFGVGDRLTFEQLCCVLARYACGGADGLEAAISDGAAERYVGRYRDSSSISSWALKGIAWCTGKGYVTGNGDGTLRPGEDVARERAATVIWRFYEAGEL